MAPCDPASPTSTSASPRLSRRQLLLGAAGLGALVVLEALPGEAAEGVTLPALTAAQLTGAMTTLPRLGTVRLPGGGIAQESDLRAAAAAFAVADPGTPDPATNPVAPLGVLVALARLGRAQWHTRPDRRAPQGAPASLAPGPATPAVRSEQRDLTYGSALPPALVVRPKASLVLVGRLAGQRILAAPEDPVRTVAGHPRLELALLRTADLTNLLAILHAKLDATGTVVLLASGSRVPLRPIQLTLAIRLLHAAGVRFVDQARVVGCLLQRREDAAVAVRCLGHPRCYLVMPRPGVTDA
ncbi:MAG: hypothetical protein ACP5VP_02415 [Candidatus Limnocylindrales bacterium]